MLVLGYAAVAPGSRRLRLVAIVLMVMTTFFKRVLWDDVRSWSVGLVLGLALATCRTAVARRGDRPVKALPLALLLLLAPLAVARAHPGVGIVIDRQGNVFYTDLVHVWRIAPRGGKSIAVRDVHTHELFIDSAGNLFGEDHRYQGGDRWRHRIWRRSPEGRVTDVVPWTAGFWRDYGFTRDGSGTMYWVQCPDRVCVIRKRMPGRRIEVVAPSVRFANQVNLIAAAHDGSLYVADGTDLRRIRRDGRVETLAPRLGTMLMGLTPRPDGSVYVAAWGERSVLRVDSSGVVTTAARSAEPWAPSGVAVAADGSLWVLEYSTTNDTRVRRIRADGRVTIH